MDAPLLDIRELKTYFYTYEGIVRAVDGVDLQIGKGETLGLVGETGCGKSVTSLSILRLVPPPGRIVSGEIIFKGRDILKLKETEMRMIRGKEIAMIFQDPTASLNPVFRVGEQIADVIMLHQGVDKDTAWEKAVEILKIVGIPAADDIALNIPVELSGGMRQRVMIAMALSCHPKFLIADEPTTNLDSTIQAQILDLMQGLKDQFGTSILLITHHLGVIAEMAERVAVLYAGHIVEYSDKVTLFKEHKHPYVTGLLRAVPDMHKGKGPLLSIPGTLPNLIYPPSGCRFHPRCRFAKEICKKERPKLREIEPAHSVACHLVGSVL
ncbi:MAG: ABC transporter ATP-binding protein [Candidatus Hodarchaeota archaeon]